MIGPQWWWPTVNTRNQWRKARKRAALVESHQRAAFLALVHSWTLGVHAP